MDAVAFCLQVGCVVGFVRRLVKCAYSHWCGVVCVLTSVSCRCCAVWSRRATAGA
jgi:hypothetical protein